MPLEFTSCITERGLYLIGGRKEVQDGESNATNDSFIIDIHNYTKG